MAQQWKRPVCMGADRAMIRAIGFIIGWLAGLVEGIITGLLAREGKQ